MDIRMKNGMPTILEVNRRPGFDGFEEATGLGAAEMILKYIVSKSKER